MNTQDSKVQEAIESARDLRRIMRPQKKESLVMPFVIALLVVGTIFVAGMQYGIYYQELMSQ